MSPPNDRREAGSILCLRLDWAGTATPFAPPRGLFNHVRMEPSSEFPFGRKGLCLAGAWAQITKHLPNVLGMLLLDGDVALDPYDAQAMMVAAMVEPTAVHTAPVKLWPASTKRDDWTWGHWSLKPSQRLEVDGVRWFSTCLTFLPRQLVAGCLKAGLRSWTYPGVDARIAEQAQRMEIPVRVVLDVRPVHLNY